MKVAINLIIPNPDQPRTRFDQAELEGLAQSIRENGLIQPIVVEKAGDRYILVDGERRWRAHRLAGLETIEALVRPASNHNGLHRLTHALVANIQRSAMGPVDEARAYQKLVEQLGTADAVAKKVGVSNATVGTKLALLEFPELVQKLFNLGRLPLMGPVIAAFKQLSPEQQVRIATRASTRGLSGKSILRLIHLEAEGVQVGQKKRAKSDDEKEIKVQGHFDALALINGKKLPKEIQQAALKTCQACALYPEASSAICRQCPLPDFLRRL